MTPGRGRASPARWRCSARSTATQVRVVVRRRLGPRALRRHPRRALRPARRHQAARRVVDRLRRTPGRGAGRRRRLPLPGPRARAGGPALRGAQGAPRGAARAGQRHRRAAARRREGDREASASASCSPAARRARRGGEGRRRGQRRRAPAPTAPAAATSARWPLDVRGRLAQGQPGAVAIIGVADGKAVASSPRSTTRPGRGASPPTTLVRAVGPLLDGKGGGKDDVAQGGGTDATRDRRRRSPPSRPRSPAASARA